MSETQETPALDAEIVAIGEVHKAIASLPPEAKARVIGYFQVRLGLAVGNDFGAVSRGSEPLVVPQLETGSTGDDGLEGVSPIAIKWMRRNDLSQPTLSTFFSLGADEIDLIAKKVPGDSRRNKLRSVALLVGVAKYLSSGSARFSFDDLKTAGTHYDAYDPTNFARDLGLFASEVSGSRDTGYSLTTRGLSAATDLIKEASKQ